MAAAVGGDLQLTAVIGTHGTGHVDDVGHGSGLVAGVHGQLGQAHIRRGDGHMGQGDVTQGGAAGISARLQ